MALIETWYKQDLKQPVKVNYLDGNVFSRDNQGNLVGVRVFDDGEPATLSGSVSASVIRADGATVAVSGVLSSNECYVILPQTAYAVPGVLSVVIKITSGSTVTAVCAMVANVYQSATDATVDPGTIIPSIETLIASIEAAVASIPADYSELWETLAPNFNQNKTGGYKIGQYVTYDGGLYRFINNHSGTWNSADVVSVNVGQEISNLTSALNIKDNRFDFILNAYYRTDNLGMWQLNGWLCTDKYTVLSGKKYTLINDLTNPVKSIYAIVYDINNTYLGYKRVDYFNSIIIDDLIEMYKNARYVAFDFDVSDQISVLTSENVSTWRLEINDVSETVHNNLVDSLSNNTIVDGNRPATTTVTWGYKILKPLSVFVWKPVFNSKNSKLTTCNIYVKDESQASYYTDGTQRNDHIVLSETFKVLKDGYVVLHNVEQGTYIEVVSTGDTINYRDPDETTKNLENQFLELGNYSVVNDENIYNTNEQTYKNSFLSGEYFYVLKNSVLSILKGKKLACIGDSITEYNYRAWVNWVMYLESWTGCEIQNLGQSGRGFVNDYADVSYIDKIALITGTPDIIGVACSFNDVYTGKGLTIDWTTENGRTAGKAYIDAFWDELLSTYPTTPIICYCQGPWYNARPGVGASDGYINTVIKSCAEHGIPFYDGLYYGTTLRPWIQANKELYYVSDNPQLSPSGVVDNVHPNSKGHKFIARYLVNKFSQNIYADGLDYR